MEQARHILAAIVKKAGQGDENARADLYKQFSRQMFSICVRIMGNDADAKDVLQDSFIIAFGRIQQVRDLHQFGGWLRTIVVNECIRHAKKEIVWEQVDESVTDHPAGEAAGWLQGIDFELIHHEIKNLPAGCREVFNLYAVEDYSHQEIADLLEISVSTSKSQYHRARQLLKERLLKKVSQHG